jgi:ATP-dependent helicase HrpB
MSLPVEEVLPQLIEALRDADSVVLEAPPGAGKTTRVPLALLSDEVTHGGKILLLEPRRIAARSAAERMASLLHESTGHSVGYRIRGETRTSPHTRIEVITEGILVRMLQSDPSLPGIGLVIFDEFHERNVDSDLSLALCMYARDVFRNADNPLKLLVMSATLDGHAIASLLGDAPVIASQGRAYPVEINYSDQTVAAASIAQSTAAAVQRAIDDHAGDVLVFLPGKREITDTREALAAFAHKRDIALHTLYGERSLTQQKAAVAPAPQGQRKIVLSSAIAESSLTIEGVRVVIDSGLSRLPEFDPRTAMTRLRTQPSSKASADQRAGRAGRVAPGVCYRLWPAAQHDSRPAYTAPEIMQADLAPLLLTLYRFGVSSTDELAWLDAPPTGALGQALELLTTLGAVKAADKSASAACTLTPHGELMADFPVHPRLAHMLITAYRYNAFDTACQLAAILSGRDPLRDHGADIGARLALFNHSNPSQKQSGELTTLFKQIKKQCPASLNSQPPQALSSDDVVGFLLACAYPDRIARQRQNAEFQLASGRAAQLQPDDVLAALPWLAIAHAGGSTGSSSDRIYLAAPLDAELFKHELSHLLSEQMHISWPVNARALTAQRQWKVGQCVFRSEEADTGGEDERVAAVISFIRKKGLQVLPWNDNTRTLIDRVNFVRRTHADAAQAEQWPDLENEHLSATLETWLAPWLGGVSHINHIESLNMQSIIDALLGWELTQQLGALAPTHFKVPSGSNIKIDYSAQTPVLPVRLQEMLGCTEHPTIGTGYALIVSLLSPAGRQIQLTGDIPGFWAGSYEAVKKDMKSRYPKHYWPDDPLSATASRRSIKPRKQ